MISADIGNKICRITLTLLLHCLTKNCRKYLHFLHIFLRKETGVFEQASYTELTSCAGPAGGRHNMPRPLQVDL